MIFFNINIFPFSRSCSTKQSSIKSCLFLHCPATDLVSLIWHHYLPVVFYSYPASLFWYLFNYSSLLPRHFLVDYFLYFSDGLVKHSKIHLSCLLLLFFCRFSEAEGACSWPGWDSDSLAPRWSHPSDGQARDTTRLCTKSYHRAPSCEILCTQETTCWLFPSNSK